MNIKDMKKDYLVQFIRELDDDTTDYVFNLLMSRIDSNGKIKKAEVQVICTTNNGILCNTSDIVDMSEPDFIELVNKKCLNAEVIVSELNNLFNRKYPRCKYKNPWSVKSMFPIVLETFDSYGNIKYVKISEKSI